MDIHAFTNHDIARGRAADRCRVPEKLSGGSRTDQKPSVEPRLRFFRRIRRRRATAATQPRAI